MSRGQRHLIHLYIRPTQGPISFMELDVDLVEQAAMEWGGTQRDPARIQEIMRQITQKFPGVQVANYQTSINLIVPQLLKLSGSGFGIVLEMQGTIKEEASASAKNPLQEEVLTLKKTVDDQKRQLTQVLAAHTNAQKEVARLENEIRLLKMQQSAVSLRDMQNMQQQLYQAGQHVEQMERQLATRNREIEMCGRENGILRMRHNKLEMDCKNLEAQVEGLKNQQSVEREERDEAVRAKEHLEQALQKRDEEIKQLQAKLYALSVEEATETDSGNGTGSMMLG